MYIVLQEWQRLIPRNIADPIPKQNSADFRRFQISELPKKIGAEILE